ncbi:hypothetical protein [Sphingobacterium lactis]|uniref:Uncharacterized protein n=1 Tax=Sphingobacterium lactis TaxID=797291 RepID=A0A1H6BTK0_9SPHI|nr:hypothetical protein [Sphingobacterium lactis]SEG63765.1 hypothetical protein SAMN05421877_111117 [Sphingobacterium lactis]
MFFTVSRHSEASFFADHLENPQNPGNPMVLDFQRTYSATAFFKTISKDFAVLYIDTVTNKPISKKKWTNEMRAFAEENKNQVPAAPYKIKTTIVGYIMMLFVVGLLGYLLYEEFKPNPQESALEQPSALEEAITPGSIFFGRYTVSDPQTKAPKEAGFGWFKIVSVEGDTYQVAMGTEMSTSHQPSLQMNSTDFKTETIPMKIKTIESYQVDLVSVDQGTEVTFTEKK